MKYRVLNEQDEDGNPVMQHPPYLAIFLKVKAEKS